MNAEIMVSWLLAGVGVYLAAGLLVAIAFAARGAGRVDPQAVGATWGFRVAILPGAAALWPLILRRWLGGGPPPEERNPHRDRARSRA